MSPELLKVAKRAKANPNAKIYSLAHLIDENALKRAYDRIRENAAVGLDGVTKEGYGQKLEENLRTLHERMKAGRYRHQPIRRVHIPKENGKTRPIGISCIEDKIVQGALTEVLEAIYEQDFMADSYGFRRGRGAHDAIRAVNQMACYEGIAWIVEADIRAYFDSLDRTKLKEIICERVADKSFMRLIGKCLHVGVLDGEEYSMPSEGTAQGSVISPMFGNIYLHHVLDKWFRDDVKPRLEGHARLIRYADDFVMGFSNEKDARRVMAVLHKRMASFGLTLHPDKTRVLAFGRPSSDRRAGRTWESFDFLGFTLYWMRSRTGWWRPGVKTRKGRLQKAICAIREFCRRHRHDPLKEQHRALVRRIEGHYNYFGVNGNLRALRSLHHWTRRLWFRWLCRRSQKRRLTWHRFDDFLRVFPLPQPTIRVQIWGKGESVSRRSRMVEISSYGSEGAPGAQAPGATRHKVGGDVP
jgi:RNA-directed DNA polymerase